MAKSLLILCFACCLLAPAVSHADDGNDPFILTRFHWLFLQLQTGNLPDCIVDNHQIKLKEQGYTYVLLVTQKDAKTIHLTVRAMVDPSRTDASELKPKLISELKNQVASCRNALERFAKNNGWEFLRSESKVEYVTDQEALTKPVVHPPAQ